MIATLYRQQFSHLQNYSLFTCRSTHILTHDQNAQKAKVAASYRVDETRATEELNEQLEYKQKTFIVSVRRRCLIMCREEIISKPGRCIDNGSPTLLIERQHTYSRDILRVILSHATQKVTNRLGENTFIVSYGNWRHLQALQAIYSTTEGRWLKVLRLRACPSRRFEHGAVAARLT